MDCEYAPAGFWVAESVALPDPIITKELPSILATLVFDELNVQLPGELEVGGVMTFGPSPTMAVIGAKVPIVGI